MECAEKGNYLAFFQQVRSTLAAREGKGKGEKFRQDLERV